MLIQKDVLSDMFCLVEETHHMPFWKADISVTLEDYKSLHPKPPHDQAPLLFTTYELYLNYVMKFHPERCRIRQQKSILAYKGRMGVEGEEIQKVGSRTNLFGNVQIIPAEEESGFKFDSFKESCKHISKRCAELEWDAVTFQNHTRIGSKEHKQACLKEIDELFKDRSK
jgi:hypothetical protein